MPDVPIRKPPPPFRAVEVIRTEPLTPRMMRVVVGGAALDGFGQPEPASSIRVVIPWPGDEFELPEWTGNEFLLADGRRPALRTFTPVTFDAAAYEMTFDIVRHPGGAISTWAETAGPGDPVAVSGPGRSEVIDPEASRAIVVGDETAIPAIRQLIETTPASIALDITIEVTTPEAELPLPDRDGCEVRWSVLDPTHAPGTALLPPVVAAEIGPDDRVWAAGEAAGVQRIRKHLKERDVPRQHTTVRGYWKVPRD
ncbi:MAG: siderophore-interacting protein [Acidimicrobiales bacterium]|nr:siderophore-interacting protein [Acidimicrobiales bacterium]